MAKFSFSKLFSSASKDAQAKAEEVMDAAQKMAAEAQKDAAVIAKKVERGAAKAVNGLFAPSGATGSYVFDIKIKKLDLSKLSESALANFKELLSEFDK